MISRPASLRARMTIGFTTAFGAFVLVCIAAILLWSWVSSQNASRRLCEDVVALMKSEWHNNQTTAEKEHAKVAVDEINEDKRFASVAAFIINERDTLLASTHAPDPFSSPRSPVRAMASVLYQNRNKPDGLEVASHNLSRDWQWVLQNAPGKQGTTLFFAAINTRPAWHTLQEQAVLLLVLGLLAVGAASRAAWVLVGRTLQPIDAVSRQAGCVAASDALSAQLTPPSNDREVRHLVETLNALLSRLHDNTRRREQWYAAAAHELRTPLAVLSGSVEVALSRPRTQTEYEETLQSLQNQTRRLIALAEGVLLLSRLDSAQAEGEPADSVSLAELCCQSLDALAPLIDARALHLTTDFAADDVPLVFAPPSHVAMLTRNLLENAVKYAPTSGQVTVSLHSCNGNAQLQVFNTHDIICEPVDFGRVFEPFYREKHVKSAGSGLGLAICRRLAGVNGWHLTMEPAPGGISVTALFPATGRTA